MKKKKTRRRATGIAGRVTHSRSGATAAPQRQRRSSLAKGGNGGKKTRRRRRSEPASKLTAVTRRHDDGAAVIQPKRAIEKLPKKSASRLTIGSRKRPPTSIASTEDYPKKDASRPPNQSAVSRLPDERRGDYPSSTARIEKKRFSVRRTMGTALSDDAQGPKSTRKALHEAVPSPRIGLATSLAKQPCRSSLDGKKAGADRKVSPRRRSRRKSRIAGNTSTGENVAVPKPSPSWESGDLGAVARRLDELKSWRLRSRCDRDRVRERFDLFVDEQRVAAMFGRFDLPGPSFGSQPRCKCRELGDRACRICRSGMFRDC